MQLKDLVSLTGVARRISLLFLIAAAIPVAVLTALFYGIVSEISQEQWLQKQVETSQVYAMKVFERLTLAESTIKRLGVEGNGTPQADDLFFLSLMVMTPDGTVLRHSGMPISSSMRFEFPQVVKTSTPLRKAGLHFFSQPDNRDTSAIALSIPYPADKHPDAILFGVLNPNFLWGDRENASLKENICVFGGIGVRLYCVFPEGSPENLDMAVSQGAGTWELFLNGKFHASSWFISSQPRDASPSSQWSRFIESYMQVSALIVLMVALLSLIQIRRTIGPLHLLIAGTRKIAQGDFSAIDVNANNEFRELTNAVNDMSARISYQINTMREQEELLRHQAHFDSLTGLMNRRSLFAMLDTMSPTESNCDRMAVLFVDIDRFKFINDTLGHKAGDRLLWLVARRLERSVGKLDSVARLGGDEFVVVLRVCDDQDSIRQSTERIMHSMEKLFNIEGNDYAITCSIGIALFPEDANNPEMIVEFADMAMYRAKLKGRNNYHFFDTSMHAHSIERLRLDTDLRHALERNELFLEYQPKVNLLTRQIVGVEALIRWRHPVLGLISPQDFIPLAEEIGLIIPIGKWVIDTACTQNKVWQQVGHTNMQVAVNLSAHQFTHRELIESISSILDKTGLEAKYLELELTESMLMQDIEYGVETLGRLWTLGVRLSLDDFGTGYSSLYYLKQFPIHTLKIDKAFVRDITSREADVVIVQSIISLAHNLKLQVIAEGVETEEQIECLIAIGCDAVQGYLLSRPTSADSITRMLNGGGRL